MAWSVGMGMNSLGFQEKFSMIIAYALSWELLPLRQMLDCAFYCW